jgi:hypothetical protein
MIIMKLTTLIAILSILFISGYAFTVYGIIIEFLNVVGTTFYNNKKVKL